VSTERPVAQPARRLGVPAPAAAVCVALGCHDHEGLRRVSSDGRTRVLCPRHAADFLDKCEGEGQGGAAGA